MSDISDAIGRRGEAIFVVLVTKLHPGRGPMFRPQFLGDKWPVADFLVELEGARQQIPYFFVQVRSTRGGYTRGDRRLKVRASAKEVAALASYPAPTYLVGIDELQEVGYIVATTPDQVKPVTSLSIRFPITPDNRKRLWDEVNAFWSKRRLPAFRSAFQDPAWR